MNHAPSPSARTPPGGRVRQLLVATAIVRLPVTVFSVLFVIQGEPFGLTAAGTAILLFSAGSAISGLVAGWLLTRHPHRLVLAVSGVITIGLLLALGLAELGVVAFWAGALLLGIAFPATHISARSTYPVLTHGPKLLRTYSWDVSLVQVSWIVAPALMIVISPLVGVRGIYAILTAIVAIGLAWYLVAFPAAEFAAAMRRGDTTPLPAARAWASVFTEPRIGVYVITVACIMFVSGLVLPVILHAVDVPQLQALAVSIWSVGSTIASVVVNRDGIRRRRLVFGVLIAMTVAVLPVATGSGLLFDVALLALGFAMSPLTGAVFFESSRAFASRLQPIVFGIVTSSQLVAQGVGSTISGAVIDSTGQYLPIAGLFFVVLGVLVALVTVNPWRAFGSTTS
ncbi:MFS transporter [Agromyces bauzanensis]|uniref:MFS transporter n=1 Tax=Agromyces bauzanensis TaxID=1308924 RepID=A0A917PL18_9MICO|nr:MFS transporter [Agromyces bauzanensis]GGJ83438.1 hypothetical protein GCM10011372_22220 [Agromyces bauzanensis]